MMKLPRLTEVFVLREVDFEDRTSARNEAGLVEPWEIVLWGLDEREYSKKVFDKEQGDFTWSSQHWQQVRSPIAGDFWVQEYEAATADDPTNELGDPLILRPKTPQAKFYLQHNENLNQPIDASKIGQQGQLGIWKGGHRGQA